MDKYINIKTIKKNTKLIGHCGIVSTLNHIIENNGKVCLYGDCGYGKTHIVEHVLCGKKYIKLSQDILITKNKIDDYLQKLEESDYHVFIDDLDYELLGIKEISERRSISKGSLIITCRNIEKIDFCDCIKIEKLENSELKELALHHYPKKTDYEIVECIKKYDGNLNNFIFSLGFSHSKDIFKQPKDLIHDLICPSLDSPINYLGEVIHEHGFSSAIIHENYPHGITDCQEAAKIMENISLSDVIDNELYKGNWEYSDYYNLHGIICPSKIINHRIDVKKLRPGSVWTKYNNYRMRSNKLKNILYRTQLDFDKLVALGFICDNKQLTLIPMLLSYGIVSSDIDVINHISFRKKIKLKTTQDVKKRLKTLST